MRQTVILKWLYTPSKIPLSIIKGSFISEELVQIFFYDAIIEEATNNIQLELKMSENSTTKRQKISARFVGL